MKQTGAVGQKGEPMRLIDADEIRWSDHYDSDGNLSKYKVAYSDEMPPTVDAIPVSFIKEQIENLQGIADYEFIASGGYVGTCNHELGALQDLLKHWTERKEE